MSGPLAQVASFEHGSSFFSWARQTAKFEVRGFLRRKRSRVYVSEKVLDVLAETTTDARSDEADLYLAVSRRRKAKLPAADEELLVLCYVEDLGSREIADRLRRPQPSVCNSLKRIRRWLLECVRLELARQEGAAGRNSHERVSRQCQPGIGSRGSDLRQRASENDFAELDAILLANPVARGRYLDYCRMQTALRLELRSHRAARKVHPTDGR